MIKMKLITRKSEVKMHLDLCIEAYKKNGIDACVVKLNREILSHKVKFPLLEYCGKMLFETIPENEHIDLLDKVHSLKTEGGNVILGIILQSRLPQYFNQSIQKATQYISDADIWYVFDIIGERVYGYSLLTEPEKTIPEIKKLSIHKTNWVIRALGAGSHYAIKKGLGKMNVTKIFKILLSMADSRDKEIRQGVGWAAKTTARFHPEIIEKYKREIENTDKVANWFRTKVRIGLERNRYAKRNRG